jgi:hypothetical protein
VLNAVDLGVLIHLVEKVGYLQCPTPFDFLKADEEKERLAAKLNAIRCIDILTYRIVFFNAGFPMKNKSLFGEML